MKIRLVCQSGALLLTALLVAGCGATTEGVRGDYNHVTADEIATVDVSTLYEVVQRLRPRWLEVRAQRSGFEGRPTEIVVFLDRTFLGGLDELRRMGRETAASLEYMPGARAQAQLSGIGARHVEGAIIVHTR
jgi:predicted small secreted protein